MDFGYPLSNGLRYSDLNLSGTSCGQPAVRELGDASVTDSNGLGEGSKTGVARNISEHVLLRRPREAGLLLTELNPPNLRRAFLASASFEGRRKGRYLSQHHTRGAVESSSCSYS